MSEFIIYLIKANVALSLFYLGYWVWLSHLTFYKINRYYFLFSLIFAAIYPSVTPWEWINQGSEISPGILTVIPDWQELQHAEEKLGAAAFVENIFWIGAIFFTLLLALKLGGLSRIHFQSVPARWKIFPYRKTKEKTGPFSFLKHIYFNPEFYKEEQYEKIFQHELVHIQQLHSLDILLAETSSIFFWYNPVFWLIRKDMRQNIEYLTDQTVLSGGLNKKNYQISLLQLSVSPPQHILGNHFNFQNLKKRMIMMNKKQSSKFSLGSYILVVPAVVFCSHIFGISHAHESDKLFMGKVQENLIYTLNEPQTKNTGERNIIPGKEEPKAGISSTDTLPDGQNPMVLVDGEKISYRLIESINPDKIKSVNVIKGEIALAQYGEEAEYGVIEISTQVDSQVNINLDTQLELDRSVDIRVNTNLNENENKESAQGTGIGAKESKDAGVNLSGKIGENMLILVDGKKINHNQFEKISPTHIKSVSVYQGVNAVEIFGKKGKDGVIEIILKGDRPK